jgi:hypothetical protein
MYTFSGSLLRLAGIGPEKSLCERSTIPWSLVRFLRSSGTVPENRLCDKSSPLQRRQLTAQPRRDQAGEVVPRQRERPQPPAFEDGVREQAVERVGGEVEDLEVCEAGELLRHGPVERVAVEDEAVERGRPREELARDGAEQAVAPEVEVAERGRQRERTGESRDEALPREGERDDAAVRGAGDAVPGVGVLVAGVPVGQRPVRVPQHRRLECQQRLPIRRERVGGGEEEGGEVAERHGGSEWGTEERESETKEKGRQLESEFSTRECVWRTSGAVQTQFLCRYWIDLYFS